MRGLCPLPLWGSERSIWKRWRCTVKVTAGLTLRGQSWWCRWWYMHAAVILFLTSHWCYKSGSEGRFQELVWNRLSVTGQGLECLPLPIKIHTGTGNWVLGLHQHPWLHNIKHLHYQHYCYICFRLMRFVTVGVYCVCFLFSTNLGNLVFIAASGKSITSNTRFGETHVHRHPFGTHTLAQKHINIHTSNKSSLAEYLTFFLHVSIILFLSLKHSGLTHNHP